MKGDAKRRAQEALETEKLNFRAEIRPLILGSSAMNEVLEKVRDAKVDATNLFANWKVAEAFAEEIGLSRLYEEFFPEADECPTTMKAYLINCLRQTVKGERFTAKGLNERSMYDGVLRELQEDEEE